MAKDYLVTRKNKPLQGRITLDGSKSLSNRALIIKALSGGEMELTNLAKSDDTQALLEALNKQERTINVGAGGTTMRFLTTYIALKGQDRILTGTSRMKERPIGVLVDALRQLGADIAYTENEGYPPIHLKGGQLIGGKISISGGESSQYLTALLLIAPYLKEGLTLHIQPPLVSKPYLLMTLRLMDYFGVQHTWKNSETLHIRPQTYTPKNLQIEADWSAASYYYAMVAFAEKDAELYLDGLGQNSAQGDSILVDIMKNFGVSTEFTETGICLRNNLKVTNYFNYDFIECPDLAQTIAVICAGLDVPATFKGLQTLKIKETDRIAALCAELGKMGILFLNAHSAWTIENARRKSIANYNELPIIDTYDDHRMAMAFTSLAVLLNRGIVIKDQKVVSKSYPDFWEHIQLLNFKLSPYTN